MRLGELLGPDALRWSHISWISADHIQLTLPASKTDPYRLGVAINFFGTDSVACPVAALTDLFERWPKQLPRDGSMFAMMNGKGLERKEFSSMLKARIDKWKKSGEWGYQDNVSRVIPCVEAEQHRWLCEVCRMR